MTPPCFLLNFRLILRNKPCICIAPIRVTNPRERRGLDDETLRLDLPCPRPGGILFIDLRDHYGMTRVVVHPSRSFLEALSKAKLETVVTVVGEVTLREPSTINPELPTGEVELVANECIVEAASEQTPSTCRAMKTEPRKDLRLKYRFLDLRRARIHNNILLRSKIISFLRKAMEAHGFNEYQTPILTCSSPEGACATTCAQPRTPRQILIRCRRHPSSSSSS